MAPPRSRRNGCCPTTKTPGERHRARPRRCRHARSCRAGRAVRAPRVHADTARPAGRWPDRQPLRDAAWVVYGAARGRRSERSAAPRSIVSWHAMPASTFWRSPSTTSSPRSRGCDAPASKRRPSHTSTARSTTWILPARARGSRSSRLPDQPEGRINLVRHLTPEVLWQERFLRHANNAAALDEVVHRRGGAGGNSGTLLASDRMRRGA